MNYYILANGEGKRWKNYKGVPKHLIEIDGETLIDRTVRLIVNQSKAIHEDYTNIYICGPYLHKDAVSIMTKSKTKREVFEEIAAHAGTEPFVILYGDCYYTEAIIKDITERPIWRFDEYFCAGPNPNTGCKWPEGYVHRVADPEWFREKMHELNTCEQIKELDRGKDWFIHWWLLGERNMNKLIKYRVIYANEDHDIQWCDETDDFDFPEDLDTFCKVTGHKCTNKEQA